MDITKLKEAGWLYVVDNPGDIEVQMLRLIRTSIYLDTNIIIEMARYCNGKRASENKEKIGELYRLLSASMIQGKQPIHQSIAAATATQ